jgi:hypothetical protein
MASLQDYFWCLTRTGVYICLIQQLGFLYGAVSIYTLDAVFYYVLHLVFGMQRCNPMDEMFLCDTADNRSNIVSALLCKKFDAKKVMEQFRKNGYAC